jgi:hypothetical protein
MTIPLSSGTPFASYSLWCYLNGYVLCDGDGIIGYSYQRLSEVKSVIRC